MYNWPVSAEQASVKLTQLQKLATWKRCNSIALPQMFHCFFVPKGCLQFFFLYFPFSPVFLQLFRGILNMFFFLLLGGVLTHFILFSTFWEWSSQWTNIFLDRLKKAPTRNKESHIADLVGKVDFIKGACMVFGSGIVFLVLNVLWIVSSCLCTLFLTYGAPILLSKYREREQIVLLDIFCHFLWVVVWHCFCAIRLWSNFSSCPACMTRLGLSTAFGWSSEVKEKDAALKGFNDA